MRFLVSPSRFFSLLALFFAGVFSCAAQEHLSADTIRKQLADLKTDRPDYLKEKAGLLSGLFQIIKFSNQEEALKLTDDLADVYRQMGDSLHYYEALYRYKSTVYQYSGRADKMLFSLKAYAEAASRLGKSNGYEYVDIGNVYYALNLFEMAKLNYRQADKTFTQQSNIQGLCTDLNNYALIYSSRGKIDSALICVRKAYDLRMNKLKDPFLANDSKIIMSRYLRNAGKYDSAKVLLRQVIADVENPAFSKHADYINLKEEYTNAYLALAKVFILEKNWDSAAVYLDRTDSAYQAGGYTVRLADLHNGRASMYIGKHEYDAALESIHEMEKIVNQSKNPDMLMLLYTAYADYYDAVGKSQDAYRYRMKYYAINDSVRSSDENDRMLIVGNTVMQLENQQKLRQQQATLAGQAAVLQQQQTEKRMLLVVAGGLAVLVILILLFVRQLRKKNRLIGEYNSELEQANLTKEKFLSVISHDLRGPFNTLIGMSNLLVSNVKEKRYSDIGSSAEQINQSSRKAYVLLDNLMQWVSLQKEGIVLNKQPASLHELVDEVLQLFRSQALAQSVTIERDIRTGEVLTDKNLLQVVLRNLISNAIRHIPVGGKVWIRTEAAGKDVRIVVEDNGPGLNTEEQEQLFRRTDHARIIQKGGGLGLVLVDQFVRQLGGSITAENRSAGGARFVIVLNDALAEDMRVPHNVGDEQQQQLPDTDRNYLRGLVSELGQYEIFDTTELRSILERDKDKGSPAVEAWRSRMLLAVYYGNENVFRQLIDEAKTDHENLSE